MPGARRPGEREISSIRRSKHEICLCSCSCASTKRTAPSYELLIKGWPVIDPKNKIDAVMDVGRRQRRNRRRRREYPGGAGKANGCHERFHRHSRADRYSCPRVSASRGRAVERDSSIQADAHTFRSGVTTVVDARTAGWRTFPSSRQSALMSIASESGRSREDDPPVGTSAGYGRYASK